LLGGWCLMLFFTNYSLLLFELPLSEIGLWSGIIFMVLLPLIMWMDSKIVFLRNIAYSLFGLLYVSLPLSLMVELRTHWSEAQYQLSLAIPLLIIFSLWINDTMAYIVGSLIGK